MKCAMKQVGAAVAFAAVMTLPVNAMDLKGAYQAALSYDAELMAAKASREEWEAGVPLARAALLPQLSYSAQRNKSETTTSYLNSTRPDVESGRYNSSSSSLTFRQALFRKPAWDALTGAQAQAEAAEASLRKELQNLGLRVASSYLEVLSAREGVSLATNQTKAMEAWLLLAEKSYKAGSGTRTDIEDARSRRDMSRAKETEAKMLLTTAFRSFEIITGSDAQKIPETNPRQLNPDVVLVESRDQWFQRIEDTNPEVQTLRKQLEAAQAGVAQAQGGHLPTVDFVAAHQNNESDTNTTIGTAYKTNYVGIQVSIPLLSGGGVSAQVRQALAKEERILQTLESTRRKTLGEANRLYLAIQQGYEQVQALDQAVRSAEDAVVGSKKGFQAGTRTIVDVLDAERRMFEAMRDYAFAIYSLANNRLKFLALADAVDTQEIESVSAWLLSARL